MNYRKGLAKKSYVTRFVLAHQAIFSHFHSYRPTFLQDPALNCPTMYNEHFTAHNIMTFVCLLVACPRCSEYSVQLFEPCMDMTGVHACLCKAVWRHNCPEGSGQLSRHTQPHTGKHTHQYLSLKKILQSAHYTWCNHPAAWHTNVIMFYIVSCSSYAVDQLSCRISIMQKGW